MDKLYGGIEAGGTWFVCAVGTDPDNLSAETRFRTTTPLATIKKAINFFQKQARSEALTAIGIGSFGPVDINPASPKHGHIIISPKPGWGNTDFAGMVRKALKVPVFLNTDVNVAALAEYRWGAAQGLDTFIYLTVGTGIGGGGIVNGQLMGGLIHPEMGHIRVPHDWNRDPFTGCCPFHEDCLEGLAAAPALAQRWGQPPETLPADHQAWQLEAHYLALGLNNLICTLSPQRIILGGGVMQQSQLFPMVRKMVQQILNEYLPAPEIVTDIDSYIVPPGLGRRAGVLGAIALAAESEQ
ncbi:MAG: ROK family protein [Dehalococcoidales bacterium]|nr:ROK family protein [Dehalococcoidales bacterium]